MKIKSICVFIIICSLVGNINAQTCDPWIVKNFKQLYGRTPTSNECITAYYNNGKWSSYDELRSYIRRSWGNSTGNPAKATVQGNCTNNGYYGICQIAEFKNPEFPILETTCGQAAAVTALWHVGLNAVYGKPGELVKSFYDYAPPKITIPKVLEVSYSLGTDWRQMEYGLNGYSGQGIRYNWQKGKAALQNELRKGNPCLIMIDMGTLPPYNWQSGGHWVVAYGYDNGSVYVTNLANLNNKMSWDQLHKAWGGALTEGTLAKLHGKNEQFITVWKD